MSTEPSMIPEEYTALVDDAAIFPPGDAPLDRAVRDHDMHRSSAYAAFVGPFVVSDDRLPELVRLRSDQGPGHVGAPFPVTVVVTGGAGSLEPAARWASSSGSLELRGLEVALRDLDDLAGAARRVVAAAGQVGGDAPVYVEVPVTADGGHGWQAALDEIAAGDLRLKLRTGGLAAEAFPPSPALAATIDAALDRELPFKCTAGLHRAVRHRAEDTGFEHHGFLNVLLATRAALDGEDVVGALEERDPDVVVRRIREVDGEALVRTRRWFTSFGCCGVTDPLGDLERLGLLPVRR